jgi:acyl-CoA synthetase (AMP-forming)/AMP-acid ligase II
VSISILLDMGPPGIPAGPPSSRAISASPLRSCPLQIRDAAGAVVPPGETGELYVRGDQVSGTYAEIGSVLDADGWFPTEDLAVLDADGYLFLGGRSDDTIIRGGENIAPADFEDVLVERPEVRESAVIGLPDPEWGQLLVDELTPVPSNSEEQP